VSAKQNLANASLKAPFDGVIASITHPYTGINTSLTESQIEIVNPYTIYFQVSADQSEVGDISVGQEVNVVLDSFPDKEFKGQVEFVGLTPMTGEVSTVYSVKVVFDDNSQMNNFRIGMTGDAKFILQEKENVLRVPVGFVNTDTDGKYLRLGKTNNKVYVDVGLEGEDYLEVISDKVKDKDVIYD
jgi:HlyD family secretion protein